MLHSQLQGFKEIFLTQSNLKVKNILKWEVGAWQSPAPLHLDWILGQFVNLAKSHSENPLSKWYEYKKKREEKFQNKNMKRKIQVYS